MTFQWSGASLYKYMFYGTPLVELADHPIISSSIFLSKGFLGRIQTGTVVKQETYFFASQILSFYISMFSRLWSKLEIFFLYYFCAIYSFYLSNFSFQDDRQRCKKWWKSSLKDNNFNKESTNDFSYVALFVDLVLLTLLALKFLSIYYSMQDIKHTL